jgi:hypothetical protein
VTPAPFLLVGWLVIDTVMTMPGQSPQGLA